MEEATKKVENFSNFIYMESDLINLLILITYTIRINEKIDNNTIRSYVYLILSSEITSRVWDELKVFLKDIPILDIHDWIQFLLSLLFKNKYESEKLRDIINMLYERLVV